MLVKLSHIFFLVFLFHFGKCFSTVTIDSIHTTISRCPNNGTITVFARTDKLPMLYSITAGPELRPYQSDSVFKGLFPGSYEVSVTDVIGETATRIAVIIGAGYTEP